MAEVVAALGSVYGGRCGSACELSRRSGTAWRSLRVFPPLRCPDSLAAGFRSDGTVESMVRRALEGLSGRDDVEASWTRASNTAALSEYRTARSAPDGVAQGGARLGPEGVRQPRRDAALGRSVHWPAAEPPGARSQGAVDPRARDLVRYSAVWLAEAARANGGKVVTLELAGKQVEVRPRETGQRRARTPYVDFKGGAMHCSSSTRCQALSISCSSTSGRISISLPGSLYGQAGPRCAVVSRGQHAVPQNIRVRTRPPIGGG
jgi:hypothetical protein